MYKDANKNAFNNLDLLSENRKVMVGLIKPYA